MASKLLDPLLFELDLDLAKDGRSAVDTASKHQYDIIFMDVHMPSLDGIEATQKIRQFDKQCIVIGLSADVNKADVDCALASSMDDYLAKPIIKENVYRVIHKHNKESKE